MDASADTLLRLGFWGVPALGLLVACAAPASQRYDAARAALVDQLRREGIRDERVLGAIAAVPRHEFVPAAERHLAWANRALPIGSAQTISQPYVVAAMTEALELAPTDRVLEIGTGSGYQAAVLARLAAQVCSVEIDAGLATAAAERLGRLGIVNVRTRVGDGFYGWPEEARSMRSSSPQRHRACPNSSWRNSARADASSRRSAATASRPWWSGAGRRPASSKRGRCRWCSCR